MRLSFWLVKPVRKLLWSPILWAGQTGPERTTKARQRAFFRTVQLSFESLFMGLQLADSVLVMQYGLGGV
jgi:hypothetical protein